MKRKVKAVSIPCSRCDGTGQIELTGPFADTLHLLQLQEEEVTAVRLAAMTEIKPTAMNNRLIWLEAHGLAVGRRYGRERLWKAT